MITDPLIRGVPRPTWDEQHMLAAMRAATRSSCLIRAVGANLVRDNRSIATGYNGAPPHVESCLELEHCHYQKLAWQDSKNCGIDYDTLKEQYKPFCIAVHAEANAFGQSSRIGPTADGAILYITNFPCPRCVRDHIIVNRLKAVKVWKDYLSNPLMSVDERRESERLLGAAGIPLEIVDLSYGRIAELQRLEFVVGNRTEYKFQGD